VSTFPVDLRTCTLVPFAKPIDTRSIIIIRSRRRFAGLRLRKGGQKTMIHFMT
jgi:hypothetical protein